MIDSAVGHRIVIQVAVLYGLPYAVTKEITKFPTARQDPMQFLLLILLGVVASWLMVYLSAWCFKTSGNWIGGTGQLRDLRIAVALTWLPFFLSLPIDLIVLSYLNFQDISQPLSAELYRHHQLLRIWGILQMLVCALSFVYLIPTLAASHRISKGRAMFTVVMGFFLLVLVFAALTLPFFLAFRY